MTPSRGPGQSSSVRVLLVGPSLGILGGQAVLAKRLLEALRKSDRLEVDFLPVNPVLPGPFKALQRIKYVRTAVTSLHYTASLLRTVPRYDIIHAFSASYFSYLLAPLPALMVARLFGRKTVLNYHSGEAPDHLARWKRTAVPTMRRCADRIAVPSGYLKVVFAEHDLNTEAIANFVPVDRLPFRLREPLRPNFFSNRNHEALYNVECTLRAFACVQRELPQASLTLAGDGSQRPRLEQLAKELELANVRFVGRVTPDEMGCYYDHADVYLNTPNIDNMPGSIIEAFACGLPVVTTNAGGIPWMVEHEKTGMMVERDDHEAVAAAALRLLREPELAARIVRNAKQECETKYVWSAVRQQWESLYLALASESRQK